MIHNLYFAYGSNLELEQMRRRCPGSRLVGVATLAGYELAFVGHSYSRSGAVATVRKTGVGARVHGVLYEMTPADWRSLDRYEGYPEVYRREVVRVLNRAGWHLDAVVYIRNNGDQGAPSPAYRRIVQGGYRAHGLPREFLDHALQTSLKGPPKRFLR